MMVLLLLTSSVLNSVGRWSSIVISLNLQDSTRRYYISSLILHPHEAM